MNVTAMVNWWNEDPAMIDRCIRSLAGFCDRVVACDGAYQLTPGKKPTSPPEEADALARAAKAVDIEAEIYIPDRVWEGQVMKRDHCARLAQPKADWLLSCDIDYVLAGDPAAFRAELETSDADAIRVAFETPVPPGFDLADSPHDWHTNLAGKTTRIPLIYYAYPGLRFETRHFFVSGLREGRRIALLGCNGLYPPGVTDDLQADFAIIHECFSRSRETLERNKAYCLKRDAEYKLTGAEA